MKHLFAQLRVFQGNVPAAYAFLIEAIHLFERLGMRRELTEARQTLADLETSEASTA